MILKGYKVNFPYKYEKEASSGEILDFKRLNIFVGSNNSGKSRFMRSIFSSDFNDKTTQKDFDYYSNLKRVYDDLCVDYLEGKDYFPLIELKKLLENKVGAKNISVIFLYRLYCSFPTSTASI